MSSKLVARMEVLGSTALLSPKNVVLWKALRFGESLESFAVHLVHAASGCIIIRFVSRLLPTLYKVSNTVSVPALCTSFQSKDECEFGVRVLVSRSHMRLD